MATRRIQQNVRALLTVAWVFSITACRDFKDYRTPYKSFVKVMFEPINKNNRLPIAEITNAKTHEKPPMQHVSNKLVSELSLDPNSNSVQWYIHDSPPTSPKELTIYYQRKAVLISHRCGCAYEYMIKEIRVSSNMKLKIINESLSEFNESDIDVQISL